MSEAKSDTQTTQTRWLLAAVPEKSKSGGYPVPKTSDFNAVQEPIPTEDALQENEVLVKLAFLSPDPYIVSMIMVNPENVGKTVWSGGAGHVVASKSGNFSVGDVVVGGGTMGAQEYVVKKEGDIKKFPAKENISLSVSLGVCGMPGVTAYLATREIIGEDLSGKTIVVTGAAGAVGSAAGQIAKSFGAAKVVGLAGSDEKCAHCLEKLGYDHMLNYKSATLQEDLEKLGPFHGFYDNTGGPAAITIKSLMVDGAPLAKVGSIGGDSTSEEHDKRIKIQGFFAGGRLAEWPAAIGKLVELVAQGKLQYDETVLSGIESIPEAFIRQRTGKQLGKMIVAL